MQHNFAEYIERLDNDHLIFYLSNDADFEHIVENPFILFTHDLSRTGAPCALLTLGKALADNGYTVFMVSPFDGALRQDILDSGIHLIIYQDYVKDASFIDALCDLFNCALANTLVTLPITAKLAPRFHQFFWWIHESEFIFQRDPFLYKKVPWVPSLTILAASSKIQRFISKFFDCESALLNVCTEDSNILTHSAHELPLRFLQVGTFDGNKGQDIFIQAIALLPDKIRVHCDFTFCCNLQQLDSHILNSLRNIEKDFPNVHFIEAMQRDRLLELYDAMDVIVVPSREETTSLVAVEALMKEKICICSDGCGICDYLTDGENAFIFESGNPKALSQKIQIVAEKFPHLDTMRANGRKVYEQNYTYEVFQRRLLSLLRDSSIINTNKNACSGCGVCSKVCPVGAITMKPNSKGFSYPSIDTARCVRCGKCALVCPVDHSFHKYAPSFHAIKVKDNAKRMASQSGGAFTAFSETVLNEHGVVYGVGLDAHLKAVYMRIDNRQDLELLKGSKYVQADFAPIIMHIKQDLEDKKWVLLSGTSCHIAGIMRYLSTCDTDRLITCDLICHGVPSPLIYENYLKYLNTVKGRITKFCFRDKKPAGWHTHIETYMTESAPSQFCSSRDYTSIFYTNYALRESCYQCKYASMDRITDITVGDYWGVEKYYPEWDDNKGISLVSLNTAKGKALFYKTLPALDHLPLQPQECQQNNLLRPTARPQRTEEFWCDHQHRDFQYILRKYASRQLSQCANSSVLNEWQRKLEHGLGISSYLMQAGFTKVFICGDFYNSEPAITELTKSIISVAGFIDIYDECKGTYYLGIPIIKSDQIAEIENYDAILVTDVPHCCDTLVRLQQLQIPMTKIIPLSFAVSLEV